MYICESLLVLSQLDEDILTTLCTKSPRAVGTDYGTLEGWRDYLGSLVTQKEYEEWKMCTYTPLERLWIKENLYLPWKRQIEDDFNNGHRNIDSDSRNQYNCIDESASRGTVEQF